jgi:hypothetical protein
VAASRRLSSRTIRSNRVGSRRSLLAWRHVVNDQQMMRRVRLIRSRAPRAIRPTSANLIPLIINYSSSEIVQNAGRLVTEEELIRTIWPNVAVNDESLTRRVSDVRSAIQDIDQEIFGPSRTVGIGSLRRSPRWRATATIFPAFRSTYSGTASFRPSDVITASADSPIFTNTAPKAARSAEEKALIVWRRRGLGGIKIYRWA